MEETRKFYPNGDSYCSVCKMIRDKQYREDHPEKFKVYQNNCRRRKSYGISPEQYKNLWEIQNGKCGICFSELKGDRTTHIDHNHSTGNVRGLLCHHCNTALGLFKEDWSTISNALNYLEIYNE